MKLLYVSAFPPNQKTGGQNFSLNAINELSEKYYIDLIFFSYSNHNCEIKINKKILSKTVYKIKKIDFLKRIWLHPIFSRRFNKQVLKEIQKKSSDYDIIYFDYSQVALYSLYLKHPYKILRMHDVLYQKFKRKNIFLEKWVTKTEKKLLQSFNKVFVPSKKDVDLIKSVYGVNVLYTNEYLKKIDFPDFINQCNQFVFYGYWKRTENTDGLIWFIKKVLPLINKDIKIVVIGGGLDSAIQSNYLEKNNIDYLGFVDNPLEIIIKSNAVIVPLFQGAGIKVKVIDSFSVGTPVIGTELAFEGLPEISGLSYCATDEKQFANFINSFKSLSYLEKKQASNDFNKEYNNHHLLEQL